MFNSVQIYPIKKRMLSILLIFLSFLSWMLQPKANKIAWNGHFFTFGLFMGKLQIWHFLKEIPTSQIPYEAIFSLSILGKDFQYFLANAFWYHLLR